MLSCSANPFEPRSLESRLTEELRTLHISDATLICQSLVSSGFSLDLFCDILLSGALSLLQDLPLSTPLLKAGTGLLKALYRVVYNDIWKPRCSLVQDLERSLFRYPPPQEAKGLVPHLPVHGSPDCCPIHLLRPLPVPMSWIVTSGSRLPSALPVFLECH